MSEMKDRLRLLRHKLDLTQVEFAKKIGTVQNTITGYETGRRSPSTQTILLICERFNVSETWLTTGNGSMWAPQPRNEQIAAFMGDLLRGSDDNFKRQFIAVLSRMTPDEWALLEAKARELAAEMQKSAPE